jgi:hypothetical protein
VVVAGCNVRVPTLRTYRRFINRTVAVTSCASSISSAISYVATHLSLVDWRIPFGLDGWFPDQ